MASVPGGQYTLFANGNNMNVVATADGIGLPPPVAGLFNLELLTSASGSATLPAGYQGVAMLSPDGRTINLVAGDYGVQVADGGPHTIIAGTGLGYDLWRQRPVASDPSDLGGNGPDTIHWRQRPRTLYMAAAAATRLSGERL